MSQRPRRPPRSPRLVAAATRLTALCCILATTALPILWLATRDATLILRRQAAGFVGRVVVHRGSIVVTLVNGAAPPGESRTGMYDLHLTGDWQLPPEWFVAPAALPGVHVGYTFSDPAERVVTCPLWLPFTAPAVVSLIALLWRRRPRPRAAAATAASASVGDLLARIARRALVTASAFVLLLWAHSLCFRGWEFDGFGLNFFPSCDEPGALRLSVPTDPAPARGPPLDGEWSGWVFRFMGNFSTRNRRGWDQTNPWRPFPGFRCEPQVDQDVFFPPTRPPRITAYDFTIPYWSLFLVTAAYPALVALRGSGRRDRADRRRAAGLCARCGYDLRATPSRCPECGTPMPSPHPSRNTT